MEPLLPIALLMIGLAVGGLATWFVFRAKTHNAYDRGRHEAQSEQATLNERLSASQQTVSDLKETVGRLEQSLDEKQENEMKLRTKLGQLLTTIEQERKQAQEKLGLNTILGGPHEQQKFIHRRNGGRQATGRIKSLARI